jgi:hypothetical protein
MYPKIVDDYDKQNQILVVVVVVAGVAKGRPFSLFLYFYEY